MPCSGLAWRRAVEGERSATDTPKDKISGKSQVHGSLPNSVKQDIASTSQEQGRKGAKSLALCATAAPFIIRITQ
jgi:hypothetical protein